MNRWTSAVAALAVSGGIATLFAAAPPLRLAPPRLTLAQHGPEIRPTRFWHDLPAPAIRKSAPAPKAPAAQRAVGGLAPLGPETLQALPLPAPTGEAVRLGERLAAAAVHKGGALTKPQVLILSQAKAPPRLPEPRRLVLERKIAKPTPLRLPTSWDDSPSKPPRLATPTVRDLPRNHKPIPWPERDQGNGLRVVAALENADDSGMTGGVVAIAQPMPAKHADNQVVPVSWLENKPAPADAKRPSPPARLPDLLPTTPAKPEVNDNQTTPMVINVMQGGSLVIQQSADAPSKPMQPAPKPAIQQASAQMVVTEPAPIIMNDAIFAAPCCESGLLFGADFLYLRPRTSAQPYAGIVTNLGGTTQANSFATDAVETGLDWNAGFRIGGGYRTHTGWIFSFAYTHLCTEGGTTLGNPNFDGNSIYAAVVNRSLLPTGDGLSDAASEYRSFDYNLYDLTAGVPFTPRPGLDALAYAGFRAAEIDNHSTVQYFDIAPGFDVTAPIIRDLTMQAWGARGGLAGSYAIGQSGLALVADGDLSLLYAEFQAQRHDSLTGIVGGAPFSVVQVYRSNVNGIVPVLGLRLGVSYTRGKLLAGAGYEFTHWFNFYQHPDVPGTSPVIPTYRLDRGDLSLDGWYLRAGLRY